MNKAGTIGISDFSTVLPLEKKKTKRSEKSSVTTRCHIMATFLILLHMQAFVAALFALSYTIAVISTLVYFGRKHGALCCFQPAFLRSRKPPDLV